ncbi:hypothetical protein K523DRAFT_145470 [Schizophyllum commune Tattone D]|nr:hypothetical protein K523DRAFT_145470 [Schizophyllum commune Tattone D]
MALRNDALRIFLKARYRLLGRNIRVSIYCPHKFLFLGVPDIKSDKLLMQTADCHPPSTSRWLRGHKYGYASFVLLFRSLHYC